MVQLHRRHRLMQQVQAFVDFLDPVAFWMNESNKDKQTMIR
jgi:hypothetical protein